MTWWVETIEGKSYLKMKFTPSDMMLLRKYHATVSRLTKVDFTGALGL